MARRLRRGLRLAAAERAPELRQRRHLGQPAPRRRRRHGLLAARRHGDLLPTARRRPTPASPACSGTTPPPASCATPTPATSSRSTAPASTACACRRSSGTRPGLGLPASRGGAFALAGRRGSLYTPRGDAIRRARLLKEMRAICLTAAVFAALSGCAGDRELQQQRALERRSEEKEIGDESFFDLFRNRGDPDREVAVNRYLWQASLDMLSFLPLEGADPFSGCSPPAGAASAAPRLPGHRLHLRPRARRPRAQGRRLPPGRRAARCRSARPRTARSRTRS